MGFPILSLIVYLPVATGIALLFLKDKRTIELVAAVGAAATLVVSLVALGFYLMSPASAKPGVQAFDLQENFQWLSAPLNVRYHLGVDSISILLVVLTTLLSLISVVISFVPIERRVKEYYIMLLLLEAGMLGVFVSLDFFVFYIFWEVMLVPMALLIVIWGSANRVYAAVKFFLYTLAGSLLMLVSIIFDYLAHRPSCLDILVLQRLVHHAL